MKLNEYLKIISTVDLVATIKQFTENSEIFAHTINQFYIINNINWMTVAMNGDAMDTITLNMGGLSELVSDETKTFTRDEIIDAIGCVFKGVNLRECDIFYPWDEYFAKFGNNSYIKIK